MWSTVQSSASEKAALFSLLDEYFNISDNRSSSSTRTAALKTTTTAYPSSASGSTLSSTHNDPIQRSIRKTPIAPSGLNSTTSSVFASSHAFDEQTHDPNESAFSDSSTRPHPAAPAPPTSFQTRMADQALQQPALSSAALRKAGVPAGAAGVAAQLGARHHTVLAPHVANAAQRGWDAQTGNGPPARGPKPATGLSTSGAKSFGRAITSLKAPMPKNDPSKAAFTESLATRTPIGSASQSRNWAPPPSRTNPSAVVIQNSAEAEGLGRAKALYDYDGNEAEDLPVREGDQVIILEIVSEDWWKCQALSGGREGIVPCAYLEKL